MSPELTVTSPPTFVLNKPVLLLEVTFKFPFTVVFEFLPALNVTTSPLTFVLPVKVEPSTVTFVWSLPLPAINVIFSLPSFAFIEELAI